MKEITSAAIIGAGALGLMYYPSLEKVLGKNVSILAEGNRAEKIGETDYIVNDRTLHLNVKTPEEMTEKPGLILVAVKNHHLNDIAPLLEKAAGPDTIIVSVLNGIESEDFLKKTCPESTVLYCAVLGMDAVKEQNNLHFTRSGKFLIGAEDNDPADPALLAFTALLDRASLTHVIPGDIHRELWYKWMINIGINQVSAVTCAGYGMFQQEEEAYELMTEAMKETIEVAAAEGINLVLEDLATWDKVLHTLGKKGKTSMLQDREAGRKTEVESFAGKLIKLADKHDVKVPVNQSLFRIIRTLEKGYGRA